MEKRWEYNQDLIMTFIDIEKAYDSIPKEVVWKMPERKGIENGMIDMIKAMYSRSESCVKTASWKSDWFMVENGLKQGSVVSPLLFIGCMDEIQKEVKEKMRDKENEAWLFADDVVIMGKDENEVQKQMDQWEKITEEWGLRISKEKCKTLVMTRGSKNGRGRIELRGEVLEVVEN